VDTSTGWRPEQGRSRTGLFSYFRHDPKYPATLGSNAVWTVSKDTQQRLWVGGWDSGLGLLDPVSGRVQRFRHSANRTRSSIASETFGASWGSTPASCWWSPIEGADLLDPKLGAVTHLRTGYPGVYSSSPLQRKPRWRRELVAGRFPPISASSIDAPVRISQYRNGPQSGHASRKGWDAGGPDRQPRNVWFGTEGGLACLAQRAASERSATTTRTVTERQRSPAFRRMAAANLVVAPTAASAKLVDASPPPRPARFVSFDVHDGLAGSDFVGATRRVAPKRSSVLRWLARLELISIPEQVERNSRVPPWF